LTNRRDSGACLLMNPKTFCPGLRCFALVVALVLKVATGAQAAVGLAVSPASVANDYVGKVSLTITGLAAGQKVRIERLSDMNDNGTVDAPTDGLFGAFTVTDGQLPVIGGIRDLNVPGDDDGLANGQIRVDINLPGTDPVFGAASGTFVYRVSDPLNVFAPATKAFAVTQKTYPQGIRGQITAASDGSPMAYPFVVLMDGNGIGTGGTFADATGHYEFKTLPGNYRVLGIAGGHVTDFSAGIATVAKDQFKTVNLALATGGFTISGRLTDAGSGAGIPGVFMLAQSNTGTLSAAITDLGGNYSVAVTPGQWNLQTSESHLAEIGYLRPDKVPVNIAGTSASNVNVAMAKATALIYGTVKDNLGHPVSQIEMRADDTGHLHESPSSRSLAPDGSYTLGVQAGVWWVGLQTDTLPPGYTPGPSVQVTIASGQAVQANLTVSTVTTHLRGKVVDTGGNPQSGVAIQAYPSDFGGNGTPTTTAADGSFDVGVTGGNWTLQLWIDSDAPSDLIGPSLHFAVTEGVDIANINYVVRTVTAHIHGLVSNLQGNPVADVGLYATTTINGALYNRYVNTDADGNFSIGVINGTWSVGVDCNGLESRGYACVDNRPVTISGANGVANFVVLVPDTVRPSLASVLPARNATGVATGATIAFTFGEPMQPDHSISWSPNVNADQFGYSWSEDGLTLTCTYAAKLPASSTISWVLNPSGYSQSFRDVAGNELPSDVGGSFTTMANPAGPAGIWTYKPFMPTARSGPGAASIAGILYVVGGNTPGGYSGVLEGFDPERGTWATLAPMPTIRAGMAVGAIDGKLYAAGGTAFLNVVSTLEVYDPVANSWKTRHAMNVARVGAAAGVVGGKLYVVGGTSDFTQTLEV